MITAMILKDIKCRNILPSKAKLEEIKNMIDESTKLFKMNYFFNFEII